MRALDFSTVKPGDIVLVVKPYSLDIDPLGSLKHCYNKYVVTTTNNVDSLVMIDDTAGFASQMLVTKDGESLVWESMDGWCEPHPLSPETVYHFTTEEYKQNRTDERIAAQTKLACSLSRWYEDAALLPEAVTKATQQAILDKVDEDMSNANVANPESAYKVMGEVIEAGEAAYRETITANLDSMNELIQQATAASAEITDIMQSLKPWRNDGKAVTVTHEYMEGRYRVGTRQNTFRVGTGIMISDRYDNKDTYFIKRVTKAKAFVADLKTGEEVGYLSRRKNDGVVLKFNDGSTKTLGVAYHVIPASTPEDVLAYEAAYVKAWRIISALYDLIDRKSRELDGFKVERSSLYSLENLEYVMVTVIRLVSNLEAEKNRVLEGMEGNIGKMKRLYELAYGN